MKKIILLFWFLCFSFSQSEEEVEYVIIQGEHTQKINNSIDVVREECTEKAINNAISGYILNNEMSPETMAAIRNCVRSKLAQISVIDETAIQTNFTVTVQAFITEESISECL
tara:strand:- start:13 stop:351 length:339 start_codon:yes stop_codon:yes gene_type:complete